ncbi:MAG TPA: UvrD-helicase domain-containing protein [Candidatus Polarisedimenticolia bacterium]|nr:UvrD-helicase domain-containing protein [Candidatus Polarisedimenticolia bacterium]
MSRPGSGSPPLPDDRDRRIAATRFDRNLVVTAGAGTGKTALLIERALNLVCGAGYPIESIAAITFTEKAAAELRRRLAVGLDQIHRLASGRAAADDPGADSEARRAYDWLLEGGGRTQPEIASRALQALNRLDAASVSTIHSFCAEILRRHPVPAGVDPGFVVDEGPAFARLFDEEWGRFLEAELGRGARRAAVWRRALALHGALAAVREIGRALASFSLPREAVSGGSHDGPGTVDDLFGPTIRTLLETITRLLRQETGMNPNMRLFLESSRALLGACLAAGPRAMSDAEAGLRLEDYIKKSLPSPGKGLAGVDPDEVEETARRAQDLVKQLARVDEETIAAIVEAARPLAARCRERLLSAGYVSFDGLLRLAGDLLTRHPEVRRALRERYRTLLVDEFQDTDPLQYEILFFIAEEPGASAAEAYAARLEAGRLFIVGDPKQSIYRFRGADIEAYRRAVERVLACGGESLVLSSSFRSPAEVIEPINTLFGAWIGGASPGGPIYEPPYEPIAAARGAAADGVSGVAIWSVRADGGAADRRRAEAEAVAGFIAGSVAAGDGPGGGLRHREIGILLRALTNAGIYARALRRAGIPFIVEGGKDFYERPEVGDLIAFLRAAANPNDGASVLAVMRSPLGAATDAELARFVAGGGRLDRGDGGLDDHTAGGGAPGAPDPFPNVRRAFALLDTFRKRLAGRSPDEAIRSALADTPLSLIHAAAFDGAQRLLNLRKLVSRAAAHARQGLSLERTLVALEEEFAGERVEGESPLADETVDAVRLLSVHKAKGLEYRVVLLPDLGRESNRAGAEGADAAWVRHDGGRLAVRLAGGVTNLAWVLHRESARRHESAEEKRVFYVACTRARERLILINSNPGRRAPWRDALSALGYEVAEGFPAPGPIGPHRLPHQVITPPRARPGGAPSPQSLLWSRAAATFETVSASARASAVPPLRWPAGAGDARLAASDEETGSPRPRRFGAGGREAPPGRDAARAAGTIVHAALETWDFNDAGRLRDLARLEARRVVDEVGARAPTKAGFSRRLLAALDTILDEFLASPLPARLAAIEILGREVPILYRDGAGATWMGACDLLYRDPDGTVVVADYKTDLVENDPATIAERYRPQMEVYLEALRRAFPEGPVRGEILLLRTGGVVPVGLSRPKARS